MMSEENRSSTDPGGFSAPGGRSVASPTLDENGNPKARSFDTLVPNPEPDSDAPDALLNPGRQADTGESLRALEEKKAEEDRKQRNRIVGIIVGFGVVAAIGVFAMKMMSHPPETVPGPVETVTVTVPVVTTVTVPVTTTVTVPMNTAPTFTSARVTPSVSAKASAAPSASESTGPTPTSYHILQ